MRTLRQSPLANLFTTFSYSFVDFTVPLGIQKFFNENKGFQLTTRKDLIHSMDINISPKKHNSIEPMLLVFVWDVRVIIHIHNKLIDSLYLTFVPNTMLMGVFSGLCS